MSIADEHEAFARIRRGKRVAEVLTDGVVSDVCVKTFLLRCCWTECVKSRTIIFAQMNGNWSTKLSAVSQHKIFYF